MDFADLLAHAQGDRQMSLFGDIYTGMKKGVDREFAVSHGDGGSCGLMKHWIGVVFRRK
jgi:hypothetical protein